jgi:prepilin-type processing-associated H-X9-DG protein
MKDTSGGSATLRNYTYLKQDPVYPSLGENTAVLGGNGSRTYKMNSWFGDSNSGSVYWTRSSKLHKSALTVLYFDGVAGDCVVVLPPLSSDTFAPSFDGDEGYVGIRHGRNNTIANVLFADGHAASITQPKRLYTSGSGKSSFYTWYYEYDPQGGPASARDAAGAAKNDKQTLVWNFRHP